MRRIADRIWNGQTEVPVSLLVAILTLGLANAIEGHWHPAIEGLFVLATLLLLARAIWMRT